MKINENSFTPAFLESLTVPELVKLQHELRQFPEDKPSLDAVLAEIKAREKYFRK
jgi:hypothetical protein